VAAKKVLADSTKSFSRAVQAPAPPSNIIHHPPCLQPFPVFPHLVASSPLAAHLPHPQCCPQDYQGPSCRARLRPPVALPPSDRPSAPRLREATPRVLRRRSRAPSSVLTWVPPTRPSPSWRARSRASLKTLRVCCLHHRFHRHAPLTLFPRWPNNPLRRWLHKGGRASRRYRRQAPGRRQPREHPLRYQASDWSQVHRQRGPEGHPAGPLQDRPAH
jgi:hypothetical protein